MRVDHVPLRWTARTRIIRQVEGRVEVDQRNYDVARAVDRQRRPDRARRRAAIRVGVLVEAAGIFGAASGKIHG